MLREKHSEATMCEVNRNFVDCWVVLCYNATVDEEEE